MKERVGDREREREDRDRDRDRERERELRGDKKIEGR